MKKKFYVSATILGTLIVSFLIVYSFFPLYNDYLDDSLSIDNQFYSQNFEPEKKIYFIGSSFGARINGTLINQELVENNYQDFNFYNLGKQGQYITKRTDEVEKILTTKPDIVLLDVSLQQYGYKIQGKKIKLNPIENKEITTNEKNVFDIQYNIKKYLDEQEFSIFSSKFSNPKLVTLTIFKKLTDENNKEKLYPKYSDKPFYKGPSNANVIFSKEQLAKKASNSEFIDIHDRLTHFKILSEIIKKFHKENIKVIIFIAPHSNEYLRLIPEEKKHDFLSAMEVFSKENSVPVYNLLEKYQNRTIWSNLSHVAINPQAEEYSKDISKIIIEEIEE